MCFRTPHASGGRRLFCDSLFAELDLSVPFCEGHSVFAALSHATLKAPVREINIALLPRRPQRVIVTRFIRGARRSCAAVVAISAMPRAHVCVSRALSRTVNVNYTPNEDLKEITRRRRSAIPC